MRSIIIIFFLCLSYSAITTAISAPAVNGPAEQTQAMISALKQVQKNKKDTYNNVDTYINFDLLTSESISPHRDKFTEKQAKLFTSKFESLIRVVAYPQSSTFYAEAKTSYQAPVINGNKAIVVSDTVIEKEDFEMKIGYEWTKTNGQWLLSDLIIDDDSLVKDYQNQFGRIIEKEGVGGLIKKVEEKLAEIEAESESEIKKK